KSSLRSKRHPRGVREPAPAPPDHAHDAPRPAAERTRETRTPHTVRSVRLSLSNSYSVRRNGSRSGSSVEGGPGIQGQEARPMSVELNHTIVAAHDKEASARFLADLLGLEVSPQFGPFIPVQIANGVTLDYREEAGSITPQHYAFLVSED